MIEKELFLDSYYIPNRNIILVKIENVPSKIIS